MFNLDLAESCNESFGSVNLNVCLQQSNVLEASPDMKRESEKEWYFGNADKERRGPFSYEEVCSGDQSLVFTENCCFGPLGESCLYVSVFRCRSFGAQAL